jgi:hypothetical protein
MRSLIAIGILIFSNFSQADDSAINSIRNEYQLIQQSLPTFKTETVELEDYALEGADAKAYRDKTGNIRLIKADLFHESGKEFNNFYYQNGKLIFALYITHRYNQHTGITPEIAKREGIDHAYDPKKTLITEDRYYFSNNRMVRWIDENKKEVSLDSKEFKDNEEGVMETSIDMLSKFNKNLTLRSSGTAQKRAAP